jgi:putative transposase
MRRVAPSQRMEQAFCEDVLACGDPLGEAARRGAQLLLQKALEAEIDEFLGRGRYERSTDGAVHGYRNGYEPKTVHTAEGSLTLQVPQIRESLEPFESAWLQAIGKRSQRLVELIPALYVKGMSQRDIEAALVETLGVEGTGRTVITELCKELRPQFRSWQQRDLSALDVLYLFLDGVYLKLRPEDRRAVAVLCAYGILADGRKVLLHLETGDKESTACWEGFLEDLKQRGLANPLLVVIDGNAGCRKAVRRKLAGSLVQRCQVHKMRNIMCKLPAVARPTLKRLIQKAFTAATYAEGLAQARAIIGQYQEAFPSAMKCLAQDLEECLTALKLPLAHRVQTRTTNLLERLFGEGKRRSKVIPRFHSETSGLTLLYAVLIDASESWRGVRMNDVLRERLVQMRTDPTSDWTDPDIQLLAA